MNKIMNFIVHIKAISIMKLVQNKNGFGSLKLRNLSTSIMKKVKSNQEEGKVATVMYQIQNRKTKIRI